MLYVGTGINPGYYPTLQSYGYFMRLEQLGEPDRVIPFAVLLDFTDEKVDELEWLHPNIRFIRMKSSEVVCPNPNACMQHGAFVEKLVASFQAGDDDYVVFTDGDIKIQRPFTEQELMLLGSGQALVAMNWHDRETLAEELPALHVRSPAEEFDRLFPGYPALLCYNTGVLGMTVRDWRRLFRAYCDRFPEIDGMLGHYAKQQWLLCYLIQTQGFRVLDPLSDAVRNIHSHGHTQQAVIDNQIQRNADGVYHRNGIPLVFAHRLK